MRKSACGTIVNGAKIWVDIRKSVKDGKSLGICESVEMPGENRAFLVMVVGVSNSLEITSARIIY
jgi:sulfopyruvate decarboxylase TPP-binding subunit